MIEIFEGRLGGGKTYSAVVRIVDHLRRGGVVCTNVELKWKEIKDYVADRWSLVLEDDQLIQLSDDQIGLFHRHTPTGVDGMPVLIVVDEAHLNFNSRDWSQSSRELLAFLTQSRKVHTDIIFISQSQLNMDKQFARLVQYIWRFRDLSKWKIPGLGVPYPLKQILCCQYDYDGITQLQRTFVKKDPRIFNLYNTNSLLREFPRLEGVKAKRSLTKTTSQSKRNMVKILLPLGLIVGLVCAWVLKDKIMGMGKPDRPTQVTSATPAPVAQQNPLAMLRAPATPTPPVRDREHERDKAQYDIYDETFRSWYGADKTLRTEEGWYQIGEMSTRGFVTAVSPQRARVAQPNGRVGWVVATARSLQTKATGTPPPKEEKVEGLSSLAVPKMRAEVGLRNVDITTPTPPESGTAVAPTQTPTPAMLQRKSTRGIPLDKLGNWPREVK